MNNELVRLSEEVFEKEGKQIPFRKVALSREGANLGEEATIDFTVKATRAISAKRRKAKKKKSKPVERTAAPAAATRADSGLEEALRAWRLGEAKRRGLPAFRIFTDQTLRALAEKRPQTARELLAIPGISVKTIEKYGAQLYRILA